MTLDEAVRSFEAQFTVVETTTVWEPEIVEIMSGGRKEEGGYSPCLCRDEQTAIQLWLDAAKRYAASCGGHRLRWRVKPELDSIDIDIPLTEGAGMARTVYKVYSRFAVLDAAAANDVEDQCLGHADHKHEWMYRPESPDHHVCRCGARKN